VLKDAIAKLMKCTDEIGPIGIFDSGVGGLTIARAIREHLPNEDIIYFGDTLHLPYGEKSAEAIKKYSKDITSFLISQGAKCIVIACNSASATAYHFLRENFPGKLIFNVIDPVTNYCEINGFKSIGVIGTKATIGSQTYQKALESNASNPEVIAKATPLLAAMVEEGFVEGPVAESVLSAYLTNHEVVSTDALILGCTHYPLLKNTIATLISSQTHIIDTPKIVALSIEHALKEKGLLHAETALVGATKFFLSDLTSSFVKQAELFFGKSLEVSEIRLS
jgi:glutamate racemase